MKRYGARVSPCSTPATISKKFVSPSGDRTMAQLLRYNIIMAFTVSIGIPYAVSISFIFPRCIESNAFEKSMNSNTAWRFLDLTPSMMRLTVRICPVVVLFFRKPF